MKAKYIVSLFVGTLLLLTGCASSQQGHWAVSGQTSSQGHATATPWLPQSQVDVIGQSKIAPVKVPNQSGSYTSFDGRISSGYSRGTSDSISYGWTEYGPYNNSSRSTYDSGYYNQEPTRRYYPQVQIVNDPNAPKAAVVTGPPKPPLPASISSGWRVGH